MSHESMQACIDACVDCATECEHCASASLQEQNVSDLVRCIQLTRECAEVCWAAARLMSMGGEHAVALCRVCALICLACAEECSKHAHHTCKRCAEQCRACAAVCHRMASEPMGI